MRYAMHEKLFAWGDDFVIRNSDGEDVYFVDGKAFSFGKQLSFQDMAGNELAYIAQRVLSWGPTYEVHRQGLVYATVKKELFTLFRTRFAVDIPGPHDLRVEGDFLDHEYSFIRVTDGSTIAAVSKRWFSWSDTYGVDVATGADDLLILCTATIIDQVCHEKR